MIDLGSNNYWSVNAIMANKNSFVEEFMSWGWIEKNTTV